MTQRILVTGGTGLLGSYLLRWFRKNGYTQLTGTYQGENSKVPADLKDITWKTLRLPDINDAYEVIEGQDWVVHSAALVSYFKEDKFKLLDVNQKGTEHIVNACLEHKVKQMVYVGSIGSIGKETRVATLNENNVWLQNEFSTSYGLSKYLGELEAWRGAAEGLPVSVVLPSVILGTGDWQRSSLALIDRVAHKSPFYPDGQTGYVDVRDVSSFIGMMLERSMTGERYILSGANMSYKEIYGRIASGLEIKRTFRESPKWFTRAVLLANNLRSGRFSYPEVVHQVYGKFSYDTSKSLGVDGFKYRDMEDTIKEVTASYREGRNRVLEFT